MIKTIFSFVIALLLVFPAYAQTPELTSPDGRVMPRYGDDGIVIPSRPTNIETREDVSNREEFRSRPTQLIPESIRSTVRKFIKQVRPQVSRDIPAFVREKHEEFLSRVREHQEEFEDKREEAQKRVREHREVLKTKLAEIQNERKQRIVERIDEQISKLNEKLTSHFFNALEHIDKVLTNVTTRADRAVEKGLNVGDVYTAIENAHSVITAAHDAVIIQVGVVYTIEITSEETLRIDVGAARQALHTDLQGVRTLVRAAHDATRSAAVALAQIPRVDDIDDDANDANDADDENEDEESEAQLEE